MHYKVVEDVKICYVKNPTRVKTLVFESGGKYNLSDGYSVRYCKNLPHVVEMQLK